jgi:hypothetical protein
LKLKRVKPLTPGILVGIADPPPADGELKVPGTFFGGLGDLALSASEGVPLYD